MATLNLIKIKEELLNLIRSNNILSNSVRNVTLTSDEFTATDGQTNFTLTNSGVKNIVSVTVNDVERIIYTDYDINIYNKNSTEAQVLSFVSGLSAGDTVVVNYCYSTSGDKIYPDYPEDFLTIGAFPRVSFDIVSISNTNRSVNDSLQQKSLLIEFAVYSMRNEVEVIEQALYDLIYTNRKNLYHLSLLRPSGRSSIEQYQNFKSTIIYTKMFSFIAPAQFEN